MTASVSVLVRSACGIALAIALVPAGHMRALHAAPQAAASTSAPPSSPGGKKVLTLADYGPWKRITSASVSDDGKWMAYTMAPNDGDDTLTIKALDGDAAYTIALGASAGAGRGG